METKKPRRKILVRTRTGSRFAGATIYLDGSYTIAGCTAKSCNRWEVRDGKLYISTGFHFECVANDEMWKAEQKTVIKALDKLFEEQVLGGLSD